MQVVHDVLGKGKKPKRIVDDGQEEKLEPLKAEVLGNLDEEKVLPEIEDQQYVENTLKLLTDHKEHLKVKLSNLSLQ